MTPEGLDRALKWGTPGHRRVHDAVRARIRMSEGAMKDRYKQMTQNEERFQAYVPESDNDRIRKSRRESLGEPDYTTIEIPYSYAVLMTAHTYYTSIFLARNPIIQVSGRHGEPENKTQAVEAVLDYQRQVGEWMVPLFIWLLDPGKYGFGVIGHYWDEQYVSKRTVREVDSTWMGLPLPGLGKRKEEYVERIPTYRGNRLYNVRPQDFFPDPRVALRFFQKGEFAARYVENSWFDIVHGEKQGKYFNIDILRKMRRDKDSGLGGGFVERDEGSGNVTTIPNSNLHDFEQAVPPGFIKSYELYIKLVPKDWGFGKESDCEIWVITVSKNGVVYGCEPLDEWTGQFPFDILEHETEGYSMFSRSLLERSQPMADIITWLVNSHFYNVRQTLNNQFIVDPSMVVMKDLENPNPGKLIRLRSMAYGKDIRTLIQQLPVADVTRSHIGDINLIGDFIQRVTGVLDPIMGMGAGKSHVTATASRTATNFSINRMKTNCEYYSAMGFAPMTQKLIQRTQHRMDFEQYHRIVGDLAQFETEPFVQVTPDRIAGFFDFVPVDGTMPVDRLAQANLWQMILGQIMKSPQIAGTYDIAKIFAWIAGLGGIKNMAQFRLTPDAALMQQAQMGNVIPLSQAAQPKGRTNLNEPQQIPGLGSTG